MLSPEENLLLCQVGPGTPGGDFHRRYWHPILTAAELLQNPIRKVRILGEDLVLFKNLKGKLGLVADRCPHRLVSLEFGIPDEQGIRCSYHGWLFDQTGQCLETPLEPANSKLASRVCIKSYPVQELGGLIFAYLGPKPVPTLNHWDVLVWPDSLRQIGTSVINCNWLQSVENSLDSRHNEYLHGHYFKYQLERAGKTDYLGRPELEMKYPYTKQETDIRTYGIASTIERAISPPHGKPYRGIHTFLVFPHVSRQGGKRVRSHLLWRVPIDDTKTMFIQYEAFTPPPGFNVPKQDIIPHHIIPNKNEKGEWLVNDNLDPQDAMAWESQGEITDRSKETLGSSDKGIAMLRRLLKEQIEIVRKGEVPMNVFYEHNDCLHLEPRLGNFDPEILWEVSVGYDKYYSTKYGGAIKDAMKLLREIADSGADKKLAEGIKGS